MPISEEKMSTSTLKRGLEDVVVDTTRISCVDGAGGKLYYRGIPIEVLAEHSTFEECAYLLLCGQLPNARQLEAFSWKLRQMMAHVPEKVLRIIQELPVNSHPLSVLQSALAALACINPEHRSSDESLLEKAMRIVAQTSVILTATYRHHFNFAPVRAREDLGFAENFLHMLHGKLPSPAIARTLETAFVVQMDHGFNPSTFTARAVASTLANMYSATSAAVGALSGALHGGASELVMEMVDEARNSGNPRQHVRSLLDMGGKVMGMGHRVYKVLDPRARIFEQLLRSLPANAEDKVSVEILEEIKDEATQYFAAKQKAVFVNVDFWTGALYSRLGIDSILYSGIFAAARMVGWTSHIIELRQDNRLYRPRSQYIGEFNVAYTPIDKR